MVAVLGIEITLLPLVNSSPKRPSVWMVIEIKELNTMHPQRQHQKMIRRGTAFSELLNERC